MVVENRLLRELAEGEKNRLINKQVEEEFAEWKRNNPEASCVTTKFKIEEIERKFWEKKTNQLLLAFSMLSMLFAIIFPCFIMPDIDHWLLWCFRLWAIMLGMIGAFRIGQFAEGQFY